MTDAGELSGPELRRVVDRIVDQGAMFLKPVLAAPLPESVRLSLSDSLGDPSRFHASPLQHLFLAIALRSANLEEIASYYKTVGGFPSRLASMIERRTKLSVVPSLVHAATEACLRFELPRYLGSCANEDASIFMLLAMDGSQASAEALRRLVGMLHAASDAGRSDTDHHRAIALSVAKQVERDDEKLPRSLDELFELVKAHLLHVHDLIANDDFSYRELFKPRGKAKETTKEGEIQLWSRALRTAGSPSQSEGDQPP